MNEVDLDLDESFYDWHLKMKEADLVIGGVDLYLQEAVHNLVEGVHNLVGCIVFATWRKATVTLWRATSTWGRVQMFKLMLLIIGSYSF